MLINIAIYRKKIRQDSVFLSPLQALSLVGILFVTLTSCGTKELPDIQLPPSSILSVRKNWAVVSADYLPLYSQPDVASDMTWVARQGDVYQVSEQSLESQFLYSQEDYWYMVSNEQSSGWAFGAGIRSYSSKEEALDAASRIFEGEGF